MLSETQRETLKSMEKLDGWEVLEVIREWCKRQIAIDTFIVQVDFGNSREVNSTEFTIAMLFRLLQR